MSADTYASLSDLRVAAYLNQQLFQLLHEPTDLRQCLIEVPFSPNMGSAAVKLGLYNPVDVFAAPGEDTATSVTNITDASATLTVAKYGLQRELTDLAALTGGPDLDVLANDMVLSANYTLASLLTAAFPSLATSVGTSGVNLTVDDIYSAIYAMHLSSVTGPFYCILKPKQFNNFMASLRGEGGASAFSSATNDMLAVKGPGFKGVWNGIEFYTHGTCVTANAGVDVVGALFGRGCYAFTEAPLDRITNYMAASVAPAGSKLVVEFARGSTGATAGKTFIQGQYYPAIAEVEDLRGVKIVTKAA